VRFGAAAALLDDLGVDVTLAHAQKVRAIADAKIKTDSIDAETLARLLQADLIPEVHVPPRDIRLQKEVLRQRCWLVKTRTTLKNRIHALLDRNHVDTSGYSDIFGKTARALFKTLSLPATEQQLFEQDLALFDTINEHIKRTEQWLKELLKDNRTYDIVKSVPGLGVILSALAALEIGDISRFRSPEKLASYAGLIPSTYASGGKVYHGHLITGCNQWLRYAFIEGAWTAIKVSAYYQSYYLRLKAKKPNSVAIVAVARKLSETAYHCLTSNRYYEERAYVYKRSK
jgi:transposase